MKVVIDTNVIISAALGSHTCSKVILWTMDNAQIMEPKIVLFELERFSKKLKKQKQSYSTLKQIESFFEIFLSFCIIKNLRKSWISVETN